MRGIIAPNNFVQIDPGRPLQMHHAKVYWLTCVLMFLAVVGSATTIVMPTDEQLIDKSPVIVEATVVSSTPVDRGNRIWTETVLSVTKTIKGSVPPKVTVREIGGAIDDRITVIFGAPQYRAGEHVLVFLAPTPRGDYQTVDLFVGKFGDEKMANGEHLWARHDEAADVALLDANFQKLPTRNVQRRAAGFEAYIVDRVAGRAGQRNYGVLNPILAPAKPIGSNSVGNISSNFTLISEPTVYRWNSFDSGVTASWYSYGTQPGYTGGGVNEVTTAMSSWTGYSAAKILYSYAGSESTAAGMSTPNGRNEILFNDPFSDIAGSWNPSTGGVVGLGGFNGVSSAQRWTATFTADSAHTQGTYNAYTITEANLTVQDGVSPTAHISSQTLAEICAHELGHTIGLGHSTDSTALMYPSVTGLGPSLRADDQLAARWLYPNGGGTTPPPPAVPAAPSNLTASVASGIVTLHWTDNAGSNETGESIYVAPLGSAYQKIGDVAAGTISTQLTGGSSGTYNVYVVSFNAAGTSAASNVAQFTIPTAAPAVSADFNWSPVSPVTTDNVTFSDRSSGSPTSWSWSFGDGTTSAQQNPVKRYGAAGTYTVTLTVSNGTSTAAMSHSVSVAQAAPAVPTVNAAFDWTPSAPSRGDSVQFFDRSSGSPASWSWSFGDGTTSTAQNPAHAFAAPGSYTVTLTAANSASSSTATHVINVAAVLIPYRSLVSVSAQTDGVGGSQWRTELSLFNAGSESASVQLVFIPGAGGAMQSRSLFLSPMQSVTYANALLDIFALPSGAGAIAIQGDSPTTNANLKVTSRTFTSGASGTYGQGVPDVQTSDLQQALYLTGLESDDAYRTNIGVVNRTGAPVAAALSLFDTNGNALGSVTVSVPGDNFQQAGITNWFPAVAGRSLAGMSMRVTSAASNAISVYASVVDNRTQDPVYIQGVPQPGGSQLVIPAVGRLGGANGTFWRSDVTIYNPTMQVMILGLRYIQSGTDGRTAPVNTITIPPGRVQAIADVNTSLNIGDGNGALQISWGSGAGPIVTSRTYTTTSGSGTYGQSIDPVSTFVTDSFVPGLRSDATFRSNLGFVNGGDATAGVTITLLSTFGQTIGSSFVQLAPRSQQQYSLQALFPSLDPATLGTFTMRAHADGGNLFAYGSIVDNSSGDPVFFAGK